MSSVNIRNHKPSDLPIYFCDSNVWLAVLKKAKIEIVGDEHIELKSFDTDYVNFFESIIEINLFAHTGDKAIQNCNHIPKIVVTSLLLSELINTYLRKVAMPLYFKKKDCSGIDFKKAYRDNPHSDYKKQFDSLIDDIVSFNDSGAFSLFDDGFTNSNPFNSLKIIPNNLDYNDYLFYNKFKSTSIPIVTNDSDFDFDGITVISSNPKLLRRK